MKSTLSGDIDLLESVGGPCFAFDITRHFYIEGRWYPDARSTYFCLMGPNICVFITDARFLQSVLVG
jgi:hypothetical protein